MSVLKRVNNCFAIGYLNSQSYLIFLTPASEMGIGSGKLRNDVWIGQLTSGSQSSWRVDDRYFVDGGSFNPDLIISEMRWYEATPGRVAPATWPSGAKYSLPLTNDEWIACQLYPGTP